MDEVNCYLVGSRFYNKLFGDLFVILSDSRFHGNLLGKNKLSVIWSDSRLHRFLEVVTTIWSGPGFIVSEKLNYYLVGSRLHSVLLGIVVSCYLVGL